MQCCQQEKKENTETGLALPSGEGSRAQGQ
jgi:hypothetical protein